MPRNDSRRYSYHDDPVEYFRRLQSYAPNQVDAYANNSADLYTPSGPELYAPSKPKASRPRLDSRSRAKSHADSRRDSYVDSRKKSRAESRSKSYADSRADSNINSHSDNYTNSRTEPRSKSYADSRQESDISSQSDNYTSTRRNDRADSRRNLYADSQPNAVQEPEPQPKPNNEVPPKPRDGARPKPPAGSRPNSYTSSRTRSYVGYQSDSYVSSQTDSYEDSRSLSFYSEKRRGRKHKSRQYLNPFEEPETKWWTRKRKIIVSATLAAVFLIIMFTIIGVVVSRNKGYKYTRSNVQVTNQKAFEDGGATHDSPANTTDGIGMGQDKYTYYFGGPQSFPPSTSWIDFEVMWQTNLAGISKSCTWLKEGEDNTSEDNVDIYNAIQDRANASLVDHRFILAIILQESHGCVRVGHTKSSGGVTNPGLMQSHNGDAFSESNPSLSILAMVQDGTQGTKYGDGLVQNLNRYGDPYSASRGYNSGHIAPSGDLSDAAGATACYASDVANRLMGWVNADSTCPDAQSG